MSLDDLREAAEFRLSELAGARADSWSRTFEQAVPSAVLRYQMWELFLLKRYGLSGLDIWGQYRKPHTGLTDKRRRELWRNREWRTWADFVLSIDVDVQRNGRFITREPDSVLSVAIRWRDFYRMPVVNRVEIIPDSFLAWNQGVDLDAHMMACQLALARAPQRLTRLPARRPSFGNQHDPKFYRQLLARYDTLLAKGHKAPVQEIAREMSENPSTVKSWLRRGREYLKED